MARAAQYTPDELRNVAAHLRRVAEDIDREAGTCEEEGVETVRVAGEGEKRRFLLSTDAWALNVASAVREATRP